MLGNESDVAAVRAGDSRPANTEMLHGVGAR